MKKLKKLPTRKPDFYHYLTGEFKMNGWQEKEYFVLQLPESATNYGKEIIYIGLGKYELAIQETKEIAYSILDYLLRAKIK